MYNSGVKVKQVGEFGLIDLLQREFDSPASGLVVGIGDDCAVWESEGMVVATTDTVVEDVHFRLSTITWEELGWKSLAVNLSDVGSMGARPRWALLTLGLREETEVEDVLALARGLAAAGRAFDTAIVGGDVVASPQATLVTVALFGVLPEDGQGSPLLRSGAKVGDLVGVTGWLGRSAAGFRLLNEPIAAPAEVAAELRRAHNKPYPRVHEGQALRAAGVRAAQDISDGLAGDVAHIAQMSGVGVRLWAEHLPVHPFVAEVFGEQAFDLALFGGEEYELVFTAPPAVMDAARQRLAAMGTPTTVVGEVVAEHPGRVAMSWPDGREVALNRGGFDHFGA